MVTKGVYTADRAASLSGVPKSTIHYWARNNILVPSISPERVKLWSFADLMALRTIDWMRRRGKKTPSGAEIAPVAMPEIRRAIDAMKHLEFPLWARRERPRLLVDGAGKVVIRHGDVFARPYSGQLVSEDLLEPIEPFSVHPGTRGPDLLQPRPRLRIVPGKLGGSPHVDHTRIETAAIDALRDTGMTREQIRELYSDLSLEEISEAIDLEAQLAKNLLVREAA